MAAKINTGPALDKWDLIGYALARDLMTNGAGEVATRLVLMAETKNTQRDIGGWAHAPLADRIAKHLRSATTPRPEKSADAKGGSL